ncbi:MAG: 4Fe-4S binding protein, partial [Actinobacteria bacterium]|nr:4Fe-4S binding protein [Actinomycetota bacterium]
MPKLGSVIEVLGRIESLDITVHSERCAVVRNRNATCTKCADACTSGAIKIQDNEMVITPDLCIGCGTCATVCPTCALEAHRPNDAELMHYAHRSMEANDGHVVFACRKATQANKNAYDKSGLVEVACLVRIEETALICLVGDGVTSITLVRGTCADCPIRTGLKSAELVLE